MTVSEEIMIAIDDALYWRLIEFSAQHDTTIGGVIEMTLKQLELQAAARPKPEALSAPATPTTPVVSRRRRVEHPLMRACRCCPGGCKYVVRFRGTNRCGCPAGPHEAA